MRKNNNSINSLHDIQNQPCKREISKQKKTANHGQGEKIFSYSTQVVTTNEISNKAKLKLRDYLFLIGVNSKHTQTHNKSKQQTPLSPSSENYLKAKYGVDNRHVIQVVAAQLEQDLTAVHSLASSIRKGLAKSLHQFELDDKQMVEVCSIRRTVKEKVLKQLRDIEQYVSQLSNNCHQKLLQSSVGFSISVISENEELQEKKSFPIEWRKGIQ